MFKSSIEEMKGGADRNTKLVTFLHSLCSKFIYLFKSAFYVIYINLIAILFASLGLYSQKLLNHNSCMVISLIVISVIDLINTKYSPYTHEVFFTFSRIWKIMMFTSEMSLL